MNDNMQPMTPHIFDQFGPYLIALIWIALLVGIIYFLKGIFGASTKDDK